MKPGWGHLERTDREGGLGTDSGHSDVHTYAAWVVWKNQQWAWEGGANPSRREQRCDASQKLITTPLKGKEGRGGGAGLPEYLSLEPRLLHKSWALCTHTAGEAEIGRSSLVYWQRACKKKKGGRDLIQVSSFHTITHTSKSMCA